MHPARSEALYFVARGDGSSQFSRTLDEHRQAVNRVIRKAENLDSSRAQADSGKFITFEGIDGAGKSTHIAGAAAFDARRVASTGDIDA
jgi:polyphosphate kinase 2 (PPK2 family)